MSAEPTKFVLAEDRIPTHWVNLIGDLPGEPLPPLSPRTMEPAGPGDLTGPLAGKWDDFVTALKGGQIYVNAHTTQNPVGEIRSTLTVVGSEIKYVTGAARRLQGPSAWNAPPAR